MADNTTLDSGSGGDVIATDDISGVKYPRSKITIGADGVNDGDVSAANPMPVSDASGSLTVDNAGTFAVQVSSIAAGSNAIGKLAANSGVDIGDVDVTTLPAITIAAAQTLATVTTVGTVTNVVHVDDNSSSLTVDDGGSSLTVDGTVAISGTVTVASHAVTNAGTFAVQVDGAALTALQLIDDIIFTDDNAFTPGTSKVAVVAAQADETATDSVDEGDAGALRMTLDRKLITQPQPHTAGGLSVFYSLDLDETEEDVKTSAGTLYQVNITNRTTSVRYVKLYNATAANVTVGTTTPLLTIPVPANSSDYVVIVRSFGQYGIAFSTALSAAATTGFADNDTGAPGTNDIIADFLYK